MSRSPFVKDLAACRLQDPEARKELVAELHKLKTDLFMQLVETGAMPLRPGVKRLVQEAIAAGEGAGCRRTPGFWDSLLLLFYMIHMLRCSFRQK